jgi:hypothetical protein
LPALHDGRGHFIPSTGARQRTEPLIFWFSVGGFPLPKMLLGSFVTDRMGFQQGNPGTEQAEFALFRA